MMRSLLFYWSVIAYDATPTILAPDPGLSVPEPTPKRTLSVL